MDHQSAPDEVPLGMNGGSATPEPEAAPLGVLPLSTPYEAAPPINMDMNKKADPPGWARPLKSSRELEWWTNQQRAISQREAIQATHITPPIQDTDHRQQQNKRAQFTKPDGTQVQVVVMDSNDGNDSFFEWVPPPVESSDAFTYRTRESQMVYETSMPRRSWSVDEDEDGDDELNRETYGVAVDDSRNSWIPRAPSAMSSAGESFEEEEVIEEEIIDDETIEEEIIDEETIEEEMTIEEELTVEEEATIEEPSSSLSSSSRSSNSINTRRLNQKAEELLQEEKSGHRANDLVSSGSVSSSENADKLFEQAALGDSPASRSSGRSSSSSRSSRSSKSSNTTTSSSSSSSASTQIIYLENDRDLEKVVEGCEGEILIEDEFQIRDEEGGLFEPSRGVLIILALLIVLAAQAIGIGIYFWLN